MGRGSFHHRYHQKPCCRRICACARESFIITIKPRAACVFARAPEDQSFITTTTTITTIKPRAACVFARAPEDQSSITTTSTMCCMRICACFGGDHCQHWLALP
jgi:hypothetical protein